MISQNAEMHFPFNTILLLRNIIDYYELNLVKKNTD